MAKEKISNMRTTVYKWTFGFLIVGIIVGVLFYKRLPDDITSPHHARFVIKLLENIEGLARLLYNLGICSPHLTARTITDALVSLQGIDYTGLMVNNTQFNGIVVRVYNPILKNPNKLGPGIFFIHGGAWILGSMDSHDVVARTLAKQIHDVVVISVEYRRAPENAFPAPLEDCFTAYKYFYENAENFGVDKQRIAIMGDSAGGNMAAAITQKVRNEKLELIAKLQVLVYPILQAINFDTYSYRTFTGVAYGYKESIIAAVVFYTGLDVELVPYIVDHRHINKEIIDKYSYAVDVNLLPERLRKNYKKKVISDHGDERIINLMKDFYVNPYFMPLMERNLTALPQAYVATAQYDCLRDDGILYAERLKLNGVKAVWKNYDRGFHAILNYISEPLKTEEGLKMMDDLLTYLHKEL